MIRTLLVLAALVCFAAAALGANARLVAAGLALWVAADHLSAL